MSNKRNINVIVSRNVWWTYLKIKPQDLLEFGYTSKTAFMNDIIIDGLNKYGFRVEVEENEDFC